MKYTAQILAAYLLTLWLSSCQAPQNISVEKTIARPAPRNFEAMEWVTGLHIHFLKDIGYELRVLEMDGSASVALNPIYLYLLVTDNGPGDSGQSRMVSLPKASEIKKVRFFGNEPRVQIDVMLDRMDEAGMVTIQVPATFEVRADITDSEQNGDGKRIGNIETVVRQPKRVR